MYCGGLSNPLNVSLGKVSKSAFTGSGSTTSTTRFSIQLKDCPETVTSASVTFGGTPDSNNKDILAVTSGTGSASGVGVQLLDKTENPLSLYTASAAYTLTPYHNKRSAVWHVISRPEERCRRTGECRVYLHYRLQLIKQILATPVANICYCFITVSLCENIFWPPLLFIASVAHAGTIGGTRVVYPESKRILYWDHQPGQSRLSGAVMGRDGR